MKPTIKPNQATTLHKDKTVSLWDITSQQWRRLPADQVPAAILATLSQDERDRIGRAAGGHKAQSVWILELTQEGNDHYTREYPTQRAALAAARTEWRANRSHPDFTRGGDSRATWTVSRVLPDGGRSHVTEFRSDAR